MITLFDFNTRIEFEALIQDFFGGGGGYKKPIQNVLKFVYIYFCHLFTSRTKTSGEGIQTHYSPHLGQNLA